MTERISPKADDLLLVIDVQNDFCPGGALAVPEGDGWCRWSTTWPALRPRRPDPGLAPGRAPLLRLQPSGARTLRDHRGGLRRPGAVARPLRPGHSGRRLPRRAGRCPRPSWCCARASDRRSIPTRPSSRTTRRPRPASAATCASAASAGSSALRPGDRFLRQLHRAGRPASWASRWCCIEDACRAIDLEGSLAAARSKMAEAGVVAVTAAEVA